MAELTRRLDGTGYEVFSGSTAKVRIGLSHRYPGASVTCAPIRGGSIEVERPVILFEVVSPSTGTTDRRVKLREYRALPTLMRYVLVEQDERALTVQARDGMGWRLDTFGSGEVLAPAEVGVSAPGDSLYKCVLLQL